MTTQTITEEQLNLYQSLFRGRTDVYARYWEKNGQANYSPAYDVNWTAYNKYKSTGWIGWSKNEYSGKMGV